jgi:hypothetical protein
MRIPGHDRHPAYERQRLRTAEVDVVPDSVEFDTVAEHSRSAVCCMLKPVLRECPEESSAMRA